MDNNTTVTQAAQWMHDKVTIDGTLYQAEVAAEIEQLFGDEYVYVNDKGTLSIAPAVLTAFRLLSENSVVWIQRKRYWRLREDSDEPGRKQD